MQRTTKKQKFGSIALSALIIFSVAVGGLAAFAGSVAAAGDVTVNVTDQEGSAVEGATVVVYDNSSDGQVTSGDTAADGSITFSSVADGDYYVEIEEPGYQAHTSDVFTVAASAVTLNEQITEERDELQNSTVSITEDTSGVWGEAALNENVSTTDNLTDVTVTFIGVNVTNESTTETEIDSRTTTAGEGSTVYESLDITSTERDEYDEVRIIVKANSKYINSSDYGVLTSVSGGGGSSAGGLMDISIMGVPLVFLIAGAGVLLYMRDN